MFYNTIHIYILYCLSVGMSNFVEIFSNATDNFSIHYRLLFASVIFSGKKIFWFLIRLLVYRLHTRLRIVCATSSRSRGDFHRAVLWVPLFLVHTVNLQLWHKRRYWEFYNFCYIPARVISRIDGSDYIKWIIVIGMFVSWLYETSWKYYNKIHDRTLLMIIQWDKKWIIFELLFLAGNGRKYL